MLPNRAEALRNADQLAGQGNINAAIAVYRSLVETDPLDLNSIHALGDLYVRAGRIQDALNEMAKLADRFLATGPPINAAPLLKKMLDLDPSNALVRMKLGVVYARAGKADEAHQAFVEAGAVLARKGNIAAAIDANRRALAINPESQQARAAIAVLERHAAPRAAERPDAGSTPTKLRGTAELAELGEMLSAASAEVPDSEVTDEFVVGQLVAAELLVGCGDIDKAVSVLKRILVSRPDAVDVRTKLKDIYLRSGMMKEAAGEFMEIARIYDSRGDGERAQDFTVRARRIIQHLSQIGATTGLENLHIGEAPGAASEPAESHAAGEMVRTGAEPLKTVAAPPPVAEPVKTAVKVPSKSDVRSALRTDVKADPIADVPPRLAPERIAALPMESSLGSSAMRGEPNRPALPTAVIPDPPVHPAAPIALTDAMSVAPREPFHQDHTVTSGHLTLEAGAETIAPAAYTTAALDVPALPATPSGRLTLGMESAGSSDDDAEPSTAQRSPLMRFAMAAVIGLLIGGGGYAGLRVYESRMLRQYPPAMEEQVSATPVNATTPESETAAIPQGEEHMDVHGESTTPPSTPSETATQPREERPRTEEPREERATAAPANNPPLTVNRNAASQPEPSKAAAPAPPMVSAPNASVPGNAAGASVPVGMPRPAGGAEPPPPPVDSARKASVVVKGESVRQVQPEYPSVARSARQSGVVSVEVSINEHGDVVSARALGGPTLLREPAINAARRWKFRPATRDGKAVASASVITFNFKL